MMTIKKIAVQAGVSIGTVDRVIHGRGRVSVIAKKKILDIVHSTNYKPNPIAKHMKRNQKYKIFVLIPQKGSESGYWELVSDGVYQALKELEIFSFQIEILEFDRNHIKSYQECFHKIKKSKVDGLCIAPVFKKETVNFVKDIQVPYVFIDTEFPDAFPLLSIFQNPFKSGFTAGKVMDLLVKGKGDLFVICPYKDIHNLNEREKGFRAFFEGKPYAIHTCYLDVSVRRESFYEQLDAIINYSNNKMGIFCVNSLTHVIGKRLVSLGKKERCILIGYDLVTENVKGLHNGSIDCLISQSPKLQSYQACNSLYRSIVLNAEELESKEIPIDIVFKENLPDNNIGT